MTELLRRLVAWVGLSRQPRQALQHPLYEPPSGASSLRYPPLPAHRSPYRSDTFIDGTTTVAVRPYLVAHEQWQQCSEAGDLDGAEAA
ncbi:hypothetical protein [Streptomyces coeruleorubidus]